MNFSNAAILKNRVTISESAIHKMSEYAKKLHKLCENQTYIHIIMGNFL